MKDVIDFLKLLADATRLNIVGLLAQQPRSGDELATILDLKASTVSHHVTRLQEAGLVAVSAQQYYKIYALNSDALQGYTNLLTPEKLAERVETEERVNADAYAGQILSRWLQDGRLQDIPGKVQHKRVVLRWVTGKFERDQRYDEDQMWQMLEAYCHPHYVTELLRELVNEHYMNRLKDNTWYWRADSPLAQGAGFRPKQLPIAQSPDLLEYSATRATLRKRDPNGDYANLKEKDQRPNPDRQRKLIVFRLKAGKRFTEAEVDAHIDQYRQDLGGKPAEIRAELIRKRLLHQDENGLYWRGEINWSGDQTSLDIEETG